MYYVFLVDVIVNCTWERVKPKNEEDINQQGRDCSACVVVDNVAYFHGGNYSPFWGKEKDFFVVRFNYPYYQ